MSPAYGPTRQTKSYGLTAARYRDL